MKKGAFDLSKFKKVHEGPEHALLSHPDGHQIVISKKNLHPRMKKELESLPIAKKTERFADGGESGASGPGSIDSLDPEARIDYMANAAGGVPTAAQLPRMTPYNPTGAPGLTNAPLPQSYMQPAAPQAPGANIGNPSIDYRVGPMQQYEKDIRSGVAQQQQGIQQQAAAEGMLGTQEAAAQGERQSRLLEVKQDYEQKHQELMDETKQAVQDSYQSIDPDRYWNNRGDAGKVSTAIGLILGGIGGGLLHQENPALAFLNKQIDRDVNAPVADQTNRQNVYKGYMALLGHQDDATKMTNAFYHELYASKLEQQASAMKDPLAQARATQAAGVLRQQTAGPLQDIAIKRALFDRINSGHFDPLEAVPLLVPDHAKAAPIYEEIARARTVAKHLPMAMDAFDKAAQDVGGPTGYAAYAGGMRHSPHQQHLESLMLPMFTDIDGTVRQGAMDTAFATMLPSAGDGARKLAVKRQALIDWFTSKAQHPNATANRIPIPDVDAVINKFQTKPSLPGYKK